MRIESFICLTSSLFVLFDDLGMLRASAFKLYKRGFVPPFFEASKISDDPLKGYLLRVSFFPEGNAVSITHVPQLGPRKQDPLDELVPQFDMARRQTVRIGVHDIATIIAVLEGKVNDATIANRKWKLNVACQDHAFSINGNVNIERDGDVSEKPFQAVFEGYRVTQFKHFMHAALLNGIGVL